MTDIDIESHQGTIYDILRSIQDPEKPATLEELEVVYEDGIKVKQSPDNDRFEVEIQYKPTIPHCSLATLIGLCMRVKLEKNLPTNHKINITVAEGAHNTRDEINKQINDKERTAAAMENPNIKKVVERCIQEPD